MSKSTDESMFRRGPGTRPADKVDEAADDAVTRARLVRVGEEHDLVSLHRPSNPAPASAPPRQRAGKELKNLSMNVPGYVRKRLKEEAARRGVTATFLVLEALTALGTVTVEPEDLVEDGRQR